MIHVCTDPSLPSLDDGLLGDELDPNLSADADVDGAGGSQAGSKAGSCKS